MSKKLTLLLTLKGRETYTKRFLAYHQLMKINYPLIIGDGEPNSIIENDDLVTQNPSITYLKFNDQTPQDFFKKLLTLVSKARTPYVMFCDNDDFVVPEGIEKSIEFLEANHDFVSCGGTIYGVTPHLKSNEVLLLSQKILYDTNIDVDQPTPQERVLYYIQKYSAPCYYNVYRKDVLKECINLFIQSGINDFLLMELFFALYTSVKGKQKFLNDSIHYVRQTNSSQTNKSIKGFFDRLLNENLGNETYLFFEQIKSVLKDHGTDAIQIKNIGAYLANYFERTAVPKKKRNIPNFLFFLLKVEYTIRYLFPFYNKFRIKMEIINLKRLLKKNGASTENLSKTNKTIKNIHNIIKSFDECLNAV